MLLQELDREDGHEDADEHGVEPDLDIPSASAERAHPPHQGARDNLDGDQRGGRQDDEGHNRERRVRPPVSARHKEVARVGQEAEEGLGNRERPQARKLNPATTVTGHRTAGYGTQARLPVGHRVISPGRS